MFKSNEQAGLLIEGVDGNRDDVAGFDYESK